MKIQTRPIHNCLSLSLSLSFVSHVDNLRWFSWYVSDDEVLESQLTVKVRWLRDRVLSRRADCQGRLWLCAKIGVKFRIEDETHLQRSALMRCGSYLGLLRLTDCTGMLRRRCYDSRLFCSVTIRREFHSEQHGRRGKEDVGKDRFEAGTKEKQLSECTTVEKLICQWSQLRIKDNFNRSTAVERQRRQRYWNKYVKNVNTQLSFVSKRWTNFLHHKTAAQANMQA